MQNEKALFFNTCGNFQKIADVGIEDFEFIKPQTVENILTSKLLDSIPQESLKKLINSFTEI